MKNIISITAFMLSASALSGSTATPELVRSIGTTPIYYQPDGGEKEIFGYNPQFDPSAVVFDTDNKPWIRQWAKDKNSFPKLQTLNADGEWVLIDYSSALPAGTRPGHWTSMMDSTVVFDSAGDAYLLVDTENGHWHLLHSRDNGRNWTPYKLPFAALPGDFKGRTTDGNRAIMETNTRAGFLAAPPVIMANDADSLLMLIPTKNADGTLSIHSPFAVADVSGDLEVKFDESWKAGWGGVGHDSQRKIASHGDDIFFVWARPVRPNAHPGTPMYIGKVSRSRGEVIGEPVYLGSNGIEVDSHNQPVLAIDSKGIIHVILGAHGTLENPYETLTYTRSDKPLDISSFSEPERLPSPGCTYPSLFIDSADTLHLTSRKYDTYAFVTPATYAQGPSTPNAVDPANPDGFNLTPRSRVQYFRKPSGQAWQTHSLVVTFYGSYVFWHNHITADNADRLFVSYFHSPRAPQAKRADKPAMLGSDDGGHTWELVTTETFLPNADTAKASPQVASAQAAPAAVQQPNARTADSTQKQATASLTQAPRKVSLPASADAFIDMGEPQTNFGKEESVSSIGRDTLRKGYLRFTTNGHPVRNVLSLNVTYSARHNRTAEFFLLPDADSNWSESTINWNNAPSNIKDGTGFSGRAISLGSATGNNRGSLLTLELPPQAQEEITRILNSGGTVTIGFQHSGTRSFGIHSRESGTGSQAAYLECLVE